MNLLKDILPDSTGIPGRQSEAFEENCTVLVDHQPVSLNSMWDAKILEQCLDHNVVLGPDSCGGCCCTFAVQQCYSQCVEVLGCDILPEPRIQRVQRHSGVFRDKDRLLRCWVIGSRHEFGKPSLGEAQMIREIPRRWIF